LAASDLLVVPTLVLAKALQHRHTHDSGAQVSGRMMFFDCECRSVVKGMARNCHRMH